MHDLTAQVTSSLLPFPGVTVDALGEDEITLDSVLHGRFTTGRGGLAWLACGPHLEVVNAVTGERLSAYCFSGGGEHLPSILAARDFSWLKRTGLLVGLEEAEGSVLCLYDLGLSRVVKAVVIPGRITAIEPLVSYGGASTSTQHLHQSLRWFFGIAAVITDLGHVLLVDLCLDDLSCSQSELEASDLQVVTKSPAEIPRLREVSNRQGRHLCLQLNGPNGVGTTALQYISRTNQLAVGFSDGYLQLWNMKSLKKEYHSQLDGGRMPVHAFTFQEPENDPRNCCYLWAVQSSQDLEGDMVSLRLLQLAFSERKCLASGKILYEGLEYCEERYSQELNGTAFPLRAQTTNTRLLSCQTIEKFRPHPDRDDSMNEVASPDTSVSIFSWQVKAYGQGTPSIFIGVFDINRWYHAQMPDSLRTGESLHNCPYLAVWSLDPVVQMVSPHVLLDVVVHDRSLSRGMPLTCPPPEQYFNSTTYNFAVETSSLGLITGCIKQWTAEEQPGSALNLRYILDWAWNKVVQTKEELDGICAPLFDSSSNFTDPQTMQLLQHSQRLLGNLSTIFHCLLSEAQELTQKGLLGLMNKNMVSSLISKYAQVVLWFCRTGLLPEGSDDDALQISRPFYTHSVISNYYTIRREELTRLAKGKWCADCLMIDGLVGQCGERLINLWKRDEGGTGQYPPPTLHALLDIYLLDNIDEAAKHAIVIYLLLDVMYSFPNKEGASVESFPTAFAIPIGLVKLVQGLWLLDHHDHQSSFELLLHPAASQCQFEWQHERVLQALMCQGQHAVALRYFHVTKPPISSTSQAKLCLSVLLHNRCLIEAWSILRQHSNRLNMAELLSFLYESCQELGLIKELLKLPLGLAEQECLEKFLQGTGGLQNRELLMVHYLQQANYIPALQLNHSLKMNLVNERDPKLKERSNTRNSILDQYGKVLPRVQRKLAMERAKPYQHPYTTHKEVSRPQPLSTITKRSASEKVMSRAGFINNVLTKIEEVWLGKGATPQSSPTKSPRPAENLSPSPKRSSQALPDPFLGTPITMTSKRKSRLIDLAVHPSCPTPRPLLSPPRPPSSWVSPKGISKAPELSLLQTPQVVKMAADSEISLLTRGSTLSKASSKTWSSQPAQEKEDEKEEQPRVKFLPPEGGIPSPQLRCTESESSSIHEVAEETRPSDATQAQISLSFDTSQTSVQSTDVTLEYFDAPLSPDQEGKEGHTATEKEDEVVIVNFKSTAEKEQQQMTEQTPLLTSEDAQMEGQELKEDETFKDEVMKIGLEQDKNEEEVQSIKEDERDVETSSKQDAAILDQEERFSDYQGFNQVTESTESVPEEESQDQPDNTEGQDVQFDTAECTEPIEHLKPPAATEPTNEPAEDLEQSTDLTDFVHRHLFGGDLSTPLTRSGIHNSSQTQTSVNSESPGEEEDQADAKAPPVFTSQKSTASVTSSEPTGTDSHSVVSVNDSDELSSSVSEEDDEEEEEEESDQAEEDNGEEEEEDSGSEVEIIEEVQGNGRLPPLQPSSVFVPQEHTHFLPTLSEQEAAEFSLITPGAEMKTVEEEMEGEVVMVRLGVDGGEIEADEDDEGQGSSYMQLKPSTTLLVPLELVEGQHDLVDGAQLSLPELQETVVPEDQRYETHSDFSLMLDMDEVGDKETDTLSMENDLQSSNLPTHSPKAEAADELVAKPEVILLSSDDQDPPWSGEAAEDDNGKQIDTLDGVELDGPTESQIQTDLQTEYTEANEKMADAEEQKDAELMMQAEDPISWSQDMEHIVAKQNIEDAEEQTEAGLEMLAEDPESESQNLQHTVANQNIEDAVEDAEEQEEDGLVMLAEDPESESQNLEHTVANQNIEDAVEDAEEQEEDGLVMLAKDLESEALNLERSGANQKMDDAEEQKDSGLVVLAEDPESATLSVSDPTPVEEPPAILDGENSKDSMAIKDAAVKEMGEEEEEDQPTPAEDQKEPEENRPVEMEEVANSAETVTSVEEQQQNGKSSAETKEDNKEETKETETKRRTRGRRLDDDEEEKPMQQPEEQPVPETPTSQRKKKAPSTPTRRTTRGRRNVTFISPLPEEAEVPEEDGNVDEPETSSLVPASPSRTPRRGKQNKETKVQASPPRRSTRKAQHELPKDQADQVEAMENDSIVASTSTASSPARRRASQRATSTRTSQRTRSGSEEVPAATEVEIQEEEQNGEVTDTNVVRRTKTPTPAKRRTAQENTPRRSSRRILSSSELTQTPLEMVEEEKEKEVSPVKRSTRKTKTEPPDSALLEEEEKKKQQLSSPGRTTRQSSRGPITLNVYPQSVRKMREETITENMGANEDVFEPELNSIVGRTNSRRPTRSKLWDHPEEDLPLLDSPLEVDSETPVADALIKRLQDEEEKQEGGVVVRKMVRSNKRSKKSSVEQVHSLPPVNDRLVPEPEDDETSPGEHSFIYSPSRRRTRAQRAESPGPSEEFSVPVTRNRRRAASVPPQDEVASEEDNVEVEKAASVSKTRKTGKRTAKSKAVLEPPPLAEVELISPLPSPADPLPRAQKRTKEGEVATSSISLRRKRIMATVYTKPVTRRKKL
ncbi:hypothetical protein PAMP_000691 [Pampus punctatissimus]